MKRQIKNNLRTIYNLLKMLISLNIIKTIYVNFRKFPFIEALHFPVFIYRGVKIKSLKGNILLQKDNIKTGLIKIGLDINETPTSSLKTLLNIKGQLTINGYLIVSKGAVINVVGNLIFHGCNTIGNGTFIKSLTTIEIGYNTRIVYDCTIFDSDIHYVKDIETGIIKNNKAPIVIGENCWINAGTIISKGSVLPDFTITARNSYIAKDYSVFGTNLLLVGAPARPAKKKVQRIFHFQKQSDLNQLFKNNIELQEIIEEPGVYAESRSEIEIYFKRK